MPAMKCYIVNSAQSGTSISVTGGLSSPDDGLVDIFVLDSKNLETLRAATNRVLHLRTNRAENFFWRGKEVTIETDPDQLIPAIVENYLEAVGIMTALKAGVAPASVRRPLEATKVKYEKTHSVEDSKADEVTTSAEV